MICFSLIQQKNKFRKTACFSLLVCIFVFNSIITTHAAKPKPLWTPEDVVTYPFVSMRDISSNGKYTLFETVYTSLENKKTTQVLKCVLVNNENLKKEIIGVKDNKCQMPHFLGQEDSFSYIINSKNKNNENKYTLFIKNISTNKITEIQKFGKEFDSYAFAPDGKSFVYTTTEEPKDNSSRIVDGQKKRKLTKLFLQALGQNLKPIEKPQLLTLPPLNMYHPSYISYTWSPNGQKIAFTTAKPVWKSVPYMTLHVIDLKSKKLKTIADGSYGINNLVFSPDGGKLAFMKQTVGVIQGREVKPSKDITPQTIQLIELKTKKENSIVATDIEKIAGWTEDNEGFIVRKLEGTKAQLYSLDIKTKRLKRMNVSKISCISDPTLSKNQQYIGFVGENLSHPGEIYVSDLKHFVPKKISSIDKAVDLSEIHAHSLQWKSFDGQEIGGILTYPQGYKKGQKVPLVVSIHGGPTGAAIEQFIGAIWLSDFSPAVFASQGYAVLAVNYRGSKGYGLRFQKLDYQDIGGGDFEDIMAGVDHLIKEGIADPDQLFFQGHSYGGFMGAWAVGHTDRFRAAVVASGITDWISDIATTDIPVAMESIFGGYYWDNYDLWRKSSPLNYAKNIKTPTLILQGQADERVPRSQALQFYHALRDQNTPTRLAIYLGEGHSFEGYFSIIDSMNETLDWFKKYEKKGTR